MLLRYITVYFKHLKKKNDERVRKDLPVFPITADELVDFVEAMVNVTTFEYMISVLDHLGRLPEHGDQWVKSVVRQPRVLKTLERYEARRKHGPYFLQQRFSDNMIRRRSERWNLLHKGDERAEKTPIKQIMQMLDTKKHVKGIINRFQSTGYDLSSSSSSSPPSLPSSPPTPNPRPMTRPPVAVRDTPKAAGFLVYGNGNKLLAQSTVGKLQEERSKYKTIKLDIADLSSSRVSLVPQPSPYDRNDFI